jgi:DNA-binding GntR family transcriptional regulator
MGKASNRVLDPADLASTEKTRAALLQLGDSPRDTLALAALWDENRSSIEHEMHLHLYSASNSPLLQELLARLVWHSRFFCDEVDNPKAWVARCANLEARRLALQLMEAR